MYCIITYYRRTQSIHMLYPAILKSDLRSEPSKLTCPEESVFTVLGSILSQLPVVPWGGKVCVCCYGDVVKSTGTSLMSPVFKSYTLFLKTLFPCSHKKKNNEATLF